MSKVYNTQKILTSKISNIIKKFDKNIKKTHLNILPFIIFGMIISESVIASDISKSLKDNFSFVLHNSKVKRIYRFFNNINFDIYDFYNKAIRFVISNYKKKHNDKRVHIAFDHMFVKNRFTVLMFTFRIGKQGIPLCFRCFKGKYDPNQKDAFQESLIISGIKYVSDIFSFSNFDLIFLADRWFGNHPNLLKFIDSLNHTYVIRTKKSILSFYYNNKEKQNIWSTLQNLDSFKFHSTFYYNINIFHHKYTTNLVISKSINQTDPWLLLTNGDPKRAVKDYAYRFGAIECLFKEQKSNGFFLESTFIKNIRAFETMYGILCFTILFLTIIGIDYSKNSKCYKNVKIVTISRYKNGSYKRAVSLFRVGLILVHTAFNSLINIRIPERFILYDY